MIYLDTHVVAWLYAPRLDLLSEAARQALEENEILISPVVLLELDYLHEIGRIARPSTDIYQDLHETLGLRLCTRGFAEVIRAACAETWTRDPIDRIIVGHAAAAGRPLVTRDETIRAHYGRTLW